MRAAWEQYTRAQVDLFNPTDSPQDRAISNALADAVEYWISNDLEMASNMLALAEDYKAKENHVF